MKQSLTFLPFRQARLLAALAGVAFLAGMPMLANAKARPKAWPKRPHPRGRAYPAGIRRHRSLR